MGLTACYNKPDFESTPNLIFRGLEQHTLRTSTNITYDSLILVVRFQDGDGDLGLSETEFPDDIKGQFAPGQAYFHNIFVNVYKKVNGKFLQLQVNGVPYALPGRFPRVSIDGRDEPLEGDIRYSLDRIYENRNSLIQRGDTLRFETRIVDRALHASPTVTSSEVIVFAKQ
ncbi:hypothetical protein GCM10027189_20690 [Rufibacter soli]